VTLELDHVLAGVGMRGGEGKDEAGVDEMSPTFHLKEPAHGNFARNRFFARQRPGDLERFRPADPDDGHAAAAWGRGDGGNRIAVEGHFVVRKNRRISSAVLQASRRL